MKASELRALGIEIPAGVFAAYDDEYVESCEYEILRMYAFVGLIADDSGGVPNSSKNVQMWKFSQKLGQTTGSVEKRVKEEGHEIGVIPKITYVSKPFYWPKNKKFDQSLVIPFLKKCDENIVFLENAKEVGNFTTDQLEYAVNCILNGILTPPKKKILFLDLQPHQIYGASQACKILSDPNQDSVLLAFICRSGKSAMLMEICNAMHYKNVFLGTYRPLDEESFRNTIEGFANYGDWQFISKYSSKKPLDQQYEEADKNRPIMVFASIQDIADFKKKQHQFLKCVDFDAVVWDECHYGCGGKLQKNLFDKKHSLLHAKKTIYMSGTAYKWFRGKITPDAIISFNYIDEQRCKEEWHTGKFSALPGVTVDPSSPNVYKLKPEMHLYAYEMPEYIKKSVAREGVEFSLNAFFNAHGKGKNAKFQFESQVAAFANMLCADAGAMIGNGIPIREIGNVNDLYAMPYANSELYGKIDGSIMFMKDVASVDAFCNLLKNKKLFPRADDFVVINCAGSKSGIGKKAFERVQKIVATIPPDKRFIIVSCGKLSECITVKRVNAVFMLNDNSSCECNVQCWHRGRDSITAIDSNNGETVSLKQDCFVFDFSPSRTAQVVYEAARQATDGKMEGNEMERLRNYVSVFPIHCFSGGTMKKMSVEDIMSKIDDIVEEHVAGNFLSVSMVVDPDADINAILDDKEMMKALALVPPRIRSARHSIAITATGGILKPQVEDSTKQVACGKASKEIDFLKERIASIVAGIVDVVHATDDEIYSMQDLFALVDKDAFKRLAGIEMSIVQKLFNNGNYREYILDRLIRIMQKGKIQCRQNGYGIPVTA